MNALSLNPERSPWPRALLLSLGMFLLVGSRIVLSMLKPIVAVVSRSHGYRASVMSDLHVPIATVVLVPALVIAYGQMSRRLSRSRLTVILSVGYVGGLFVTYALAEAGVDGGHGFEVCLNFSNVLLAQLWAITVDVFSPYTGKRVLGVIASGAALAGVAYVAWLASFFEYVGVNLRLTLLGACSALLLALVLTWITAAKSAEPDPPANPPGGRNGFELLRHDAHVRRIAALVAASACVVWILGERVPDTVAEPWIQNHSLAVSAVVLLLQIGLLPVLLPRLSVRWLLLVAPALAVVEVGLLLALSASHATLPARAVASISSAWDVVAVTALFLTASRNARYDGQVMVLLLGPVVGRACGSIITGSLTFLGAGPLWLTLAPLAPVAAWVWLALGIARHMDEPALLENA